jgi:hypothetical protein
MKNCSPAHAAIFAVTMVMRDFEAKGVWHSHDSIGGHNYAATLFRSGWKSFWLADGDCRVPAGLRYEQKARCDGDGSVGPGRYDHDAYIAHLERQDFDWRMQRMPGDEHREGAMPWSAYRVGKIYVVETGGLWVGTMRGPELKPSDLVCL